MASLEEKLADLRECGIHFASREALQVCVRMSGERGLRSVSFDSLLSRIGGDYLDAAGVLVPSGEGVWHLDTECIYDADDYVKVVDRLVRLTRGDLQLENVSAHFGETAWVRCRHNGQDHHWDLRVNDDWIDLTLIINVDGVLRASASPRRFCCFDSDTQDLLLVCPTWEEFERLGELAETDFGPVAGQW
ncbi:MAG TPA: hypothetical protein P5572_01585 [Phycisphaerae bacterium]|nr:hypothetical protein [Phycisphaerae bacterium]